MDFLVLSPPACTPAEPPSGAFLLAAGLAGHGYEAGFFDLSLAFYHAVLSDSGIPGPSSAAPIEYLVDAPEGYEPMRHRSAIGVLHRRLQGFAARHPGWKLTLMDIACPGQPQSPPAVDRLLAAAPSPFLELWRDRLGPLLDRYRPTQVLISLAYLSQLPGAIDLARFLRARGIEPVVGGSLPTSLASTGSGLGSLGSVLPRIVTGDGASLISAGAREPLLGRLAWPALLGDAPYLSCRPIVPLALSTGCFWSRCLFCPDRGAPFQPVPEEALDAMLGSMPPEIATRRPLVHLLDSALPPRRLERFLPIAKSRKVGFYGFARPTADLLRNGLLERAAESGLSMLQLGAESGSRALLDRFDKGIDPEESERVIRRAADLGVRTYLYLLFGLPGEDAADREATLERVARNGDAIDFLNLSLFNLPRHCELTARKEEFGIAISDFPEDDAIRLYWSFTVGGASPRDEARAFLRHRFTPHPSIRPAILRTPRWLRAAHLALMRLPGRKPVA